MQKLRQRKVVVTVMSVLLFVLVGTQLAWAVAATSSELPFDAAGEKVYKSGRGTWVPIIVFFILFALAIAFAVGVQRLAGVTTRAAIALGILGVACGAGGLTFLFPGLVTGLVL